MSCRTDMDFRFWSDMLRPSLPGVRQGVIFVALIALWLGVTRVFIGFRPEHLFLALLMCALFFFNASTRRLVLALAPFAVFGISYDWMNLLPNYEINQVDVGGIYNLEKNIFGISTATGVVTPNEYFAAHTCGFADLLAGLFYLCWVPVPMAFGVWLYVSGRRKAYLHFALVFLLVNFIGFIGYYIHPAAAPWYVSAFGPEAEAVKGTLGQTAGLGAFDDMTGWGVFSALYSRNSNVFAAVPSLHSAYVLVAFIYALRARCPRWLSVALFLISAGIWWSAVYTSHHYVIDVILGILTALAGTALFEYGLMHLGFFKHWIAGYLGAITPAKK